MASVDEVLNKLQQLREDRMAREKARIEKLRELNLKKYSKDEPQLVKSSTSNMSIVNKSAKINNSSSTANNRVSVAAKTTGSNNKGSNRPLSARSPTKKLIVTKPIPMLHSTTTKRIPNTKTDDKPPTLHSTTTKQIYNTKTDDKPPTLHSTTTKQIHNTKTDDKAVNNNNKFMSVNVRTSNVDKIIENKTKSINHTKQFVKDLSSRKSFAPNFGSLKTNPAKPVGVHRKSMLPPKSQQNTEQISNRESVFERLYKPKTVPKKPETDVQKVCKNLNCLKKVLKESRLTCDSNKEHACIRKSSIEPPIRRSISAVHFKRISKNELGNCVHKWSSIGENLNKEHLHEINEDYAIKEDKIVSAVKSERKKVQFNTPLLHNMPRPEELQTRLTEWLKKRGKSIDSYHHLQCFGLHHLDQRMKPFNLEKEVMNKEVYDEENKENVALESDSDNESYTENMNEEKNEVRAVNGDLNKWRRASNVNDSMDLNETHETTVNSEEVNVHHIDELVLGALNDLTELLREGYPWEQGARWLRAVRERCPRAALSAPYWECRAALDERRGDLPASLRCWEEALASGAQESVADANLDQLLAKFMQLNIDPKPSGESDKPANNRLVDVKNVFKSTIIRFAVQQAKMRQSDGPRYTVTPVRRSGRLSALYRQTPSTTRTPVGKRTPLQLCSSVKQAGALAQTLVFVPNKELCESP